MNIILSHQPWVEELLHTFVQVLSMQAHFEKILKNVLKWDERDLGILLSWFGP